MCEKTHFHERPPNEVSLESNRRDKNVGALFG